METLCQGRAEEGHELCQCCQAWAVIELNLYSLAWPGTGAGTARETAWQAGRQAAGHLPWVWGCPWAWAEQLPAPLLQQGPAWHRSSLPSVGHPWQAGSGETKPAPPPQPQQLNGQARPCLGTMPGPMGTATARPWAGGTKLQANQEDSLTTQPSLGHSTASPGPPHLPLGSLLPLGTPAPWLCPPSILQPLEMPPAPGAHSPGGTSTRGQGDEEATAGCSQTGGPWAPLRGWESH